MHFAEYASPVGKLLLLSDGNALTGLWMDREPPADAVPGEDTPVLRQAKRWLDAYFRGEASGVDFLLSADGTDFQRQVWELLLAIPFGETRTYGDIAREIGLRMGKEKMSAQAVGGAVGRNPISITPDRWGERTAYRLCRRPGAQAVAPAPRGLGR